MKKPLRHILDYLILTLIVTVAVVATLYFNGSKNIQLGIIIGFSILYIVWGILHHKKEKTLETSIVIEYSLMALLGCLLVIGLLK